MDRSKWTVNKNRQHISTVKCSSWRPRPWRFTCKWWFVSPGRCFAAVIVLFGGCFATCGYFEFGGCFVAVPLLPNALPPWLCYSIDASPPSRASCCSFLASLAIDFCAGPALRVAFVWVACLECPPPPCFFCCLWPFVSLSVFFLQCFFFVSPFVFLCGPSPIWPQQGCVCNCFLLNEKRAQARS